MVSLIAAVSLNRVIGRQGGLPWKLPDDMKFFMRTTTGHTIIMGRKTWESFPGTLPNRRHIVITRQSDYTAEGAEVVATLDQALALAADAGDREVFVIGGGEIYAQAIDRADRLYLTRVHAEVEGDVLFPEIDESRWRLMQQDEHPADERHAYAFTFIRYESKSKS
ncbi:dihydrofolate reductase [Planctomycetales bacterium ZRK34]|nr:dihydrofolate reductase [Planctomycetales bacterium ZRK34]